MRLYGNQTFESILVRIDSIVDSIVEFMVQRYENLFHF